MRSGGLLAIIPARGGSKGLPNKNTLALAGVPLVAHAILFARMCPQISRIVVSTDSAAIRDIAEKYGAAVPFLRPAELAGDDAPTWGVMQHALWRMEELDDVRYEWVLLLQPTSPLRLPEDLTQAIQTLESDERSVGVISISDVASNPTYTGVSTEGGYLKRFWPQEPAPRRRQDAPLLRTINGLLYLWRRSFVAETSQFELERAPHRYIVTPRERSVDIDDRFDLRMAELLVQSGACPLPWLQESAGRSAIVSPGSSATVRAQARPLASGSVLREGRCFVIAEAGVNHNGDPALARKLVDAAAEAGADAIKFQTFRAEAVTAAIAPKAPYQVASTGAGESQLEMIRKLQLPADAWAGLAQYCHSRTIMFLSTAFDAASVDLLQGLAVPIFKIPSGEITNFPLIEHVASTGKPIILSTGMSSLEEVRAAVQTIRQRSSAELFLLQCVSNYPAAFGSMNLRAMQTMREDFGLPVGLSDHSPGIEAAIAAVALGACIIEKHFTLDRNLPGPDHQASLEPRQFAAMVEAIRNIESALGTGEKLPAAEETAVAAVARRSLVAARTLPAGATITEECVSILRPGTGLPPAMLPKLLGRRVRNEVAAGQLFRLDDLL